MSKNNLQPDGPVPLQAGRDHARSPAPSGTDAPPEGAPSPDDPATLIPAGQAVNSKYTYQISAHRMGGDMSGASASWTAPALWRFLTANPRLGESPPRDLRAASGLRLLQRRFSSIHESTTPMACATRTRPATPIPKGLRHKAHAGLPWETGK